MKSDTFLLFWAHVCFCTYLSFTDVFNSTFELYLPFFHELFPLSEQMNHITEIHELIQFPFFMVLSFVHLVLNHSSAYTVFCLHGCFSKVSKNRVSRGPPVPKQLSPHHLSAFLFFTILNPHRSVSKTEAAPYKFETLQCQLRIVKRGERQYITVSFSTFIRKE